MLCADRIPAIIGENLETEEAKNLYRIKVNLERNTYSEADRARYVAEKVRLEGVVRKGKSAANAKSVAVKKDAQKATLVTGRGIVSPATQLAEQFGYSKDTMLRRFKEWAAGVGYQGPMSSARDTL